MRSSIKQFYYVFAIAIVCAMGEVQALTVGDKAPQIIGRELSGSLFALSRAEKKPKVINFFWVQCQPCKKEIPLLAKKAKQYTQVDFMVIHAEANPKTDSNYTIDDVKGFVSQLESAPNKVILGSPRLKDLYGIKGFPYSVLLSADNTIEKILLGFNQGTVTQLEAWLAKQ